jgi:hypothetical protein
MEKIEGMPDNLDDMQSQGSYMVKDNKGSKFDDMQSQASYMVKQGGA